MEIYRSQQSAVSDAFVENILGLWQATPSQAVDYAASRGWCVSIEGESSDDGQTMACVNRKQKIVTYFEYCMLDGKRKRSLIDAMTHYHELIHLMDVELQRPLIRGRIRSYQNLTAFCGDHERLSRTAIAENAYYLSVNRAFEMPPELDMSEQAYGWTVATSEARAQAGAEYIVNGRGPIMELAPKTTQRVLRDLKRTLPSLLKLSPAFGFL